MKRAACETCVSFTSVALLEFLLALFACKCVWAFKDGRSKFSVVILHVYRSILYDLRSSHTPGDQLSLIEK